MKTLLFSGLIFIIPFVGFAQSETEQNQIITEMKTPMLGLRTVCYKVGELDEAKKWYSKAFQTEPYFDEPFYVGFNIGGYELGLLPEEKPTKDKTESVLAYWGVDDIEKEFKRIVALGAEEHEKPTNYGGTLMIAAVKDPWGNIIGLIYNTEFKLEEQHK